MIIGYTCGVYDLFHIGHLNLLKNAKGMCDKLVVGVTADELVSYKGKHAMIPYEDRDRYYWFPVHQVYNLKRLEILEMEIDNQLKQLKEEGYGEG